jgi:hypothetical protein
MTFMSVGWANPAFARSCQLFTNLRVHHRVFGPRWRRIGASGGLLAEDTVLERRRDVRPYFFQRRGVFSKLFSRCRLSRCDSRRTFVWVSASRVELVEWLVAFRLTSCASPRRLDDFHSRRIGEANR